MKRRIIFALIALVMFGSLAYVYMNNVFFPVKLKEFLIKKSEEYFNGRQVSFSSIRFEPIRGFVLTDIEIDEKDNPKEIFFEADEVSFNLVFAALWKEKSIIIPSVIIKKPQLKIVRLEANTWNFSDLIKTSNPPEKKNKFQVYLRKFVIQDATLDYLDHTDPEIFEETLTKTNIEAILTLNRTIQFKLETTPENTGALIKTEGVYDIAKKTAQAKLTLNNILLHKYAPLALPSGSLINIPKANLSLLDANIEMDVAAFKILGTGQMILADPQIIAGTTIAQAKNLVLDKINFLIQQNSFQATTSVNATSLNLTLDHTKTLGSDILADIEKISYIDGKLFAEGNFKAANFSYSAPEESAKGQLSSDKLTLSLINNELTLTGNILAEGSDLHLKNNQSFKSDVLALNNFSISKKDAQLNLTTQWQADNASLQINKGQTLSGQIKSNQTSVALDGTSLKLQSQINIANAVIHNGPSMVITGNPLLNISLQTDLNDSTKLSFSGDLQADQTIIQGVEQVGNLTIRTGSVKFTEASATTGNLVVEGIGTLAAISGSISNFTDPFIDASVNSNSVDLATILPFIPKEQLKKDWSVTGTTELQLNIKGLAKHLGVEHITCFAKLKDVRLGGKNLPAPIEHINGQINIADNLISWHELSARFQNNGFTLNGKMVNTGAPVIDLKVDPANDNSIKLSLISQLRILHGAFQVVSLNGMYYQTTFDLKGDVKFPIGAEPDLDIRGTMVLDLNDLKHLSPELETKLEPLHLKGVVSAEGLFKGSPKNWQNWQLSLAASSPQIMLMDHPFDSVDFKITQRDQNISKFDLKATLYNGNLNSSSQIDLRNPSLAFSTETLLENLDLSLLRSQKKVKEKKLSGSLTAALNASGPLNDLSLIKGTGSFTIINGFLGQIVPQFEEAYFTDAAGTFMIADKKITTENTTANSQTIILTARGYVDFSGNLNFNIVPKLSEVVLAKQENLQIDPLHLLSRAVNIKVTGTVDKPRYSVETSPVRIIENTGTIIREGVGEILKDLF